MTVHQSSPSEEPWSAYHRGFQDGQHQAFVDLQVHVATYKQRLLDALNQHSEKELLLDVNDPDQVADAIVEVLDKMRTDLNNQAEEIGQLRASKQVLHAEVVRLQDRLDENKS